MTAATLRACPDRRSPAGARCDDGGGRMSAAEIARRLSKAQREAVLAAECVAFGPYPPRIEVKAAPAWRALVRLGLGSPSSALSSWRGKNDRAVLNALGLEVRALLQAEQS